MRTQLNRRVKSQNPRLSLHRLNFDDLSSQTKLFATIVQIFDRCSFPPSNHSKLTSLFARFCQFTVYFKNIVVKFKVIARLNSAFNCNLNRDGNWKEGSISSRRWQKGRNREKKSEAGKRSIIRNKGETRGQRQTHLTSELFANGGAHPSSYWHGDEKNERARRGSDKSTSGV